MVVAGARQEGESFNGDRVSVGKDEGLLQMDGGNGCTTPWMC